MAYVLTFPANSFTHFVYDKSTNALKYLAGYNNIPEDQFWEDAIPCGYFGASQFCQPLDCNDELTLVFQWDRTGAEYPVINIRDLEDNLIGILDHPTEIPSLSGWFTLTFSVNDLCDGTDCFDPYSGCFRFSIESVVNILTDGDNGTFESGTLDGFTTGQDNGVAISTVEARTGTYSALVTAATSGIGNRVWLQSTQVIAFEPCDTYTFSAWIWLPLGNEVLDGVCYSGGGACAGSCSPAINVNVTDATQGVDYTIDSITGWSYCPAPPTPTNRDDWYEISITVTAIRAFSSRVSIRSGNDDRRRANGIMYVDDITVIPENTGIIEARSEKFCFANALTSCTSKAIYSNTIPAYGQPDAFSTEIRLPAQLAQDYRKSKHEPFRYSDGVVENVYSDIQTGRAFETGYMPKYMHDILVMALHSNSFVLVNESTNDEVQYSPVSDYDQNKPDRFILSTANIDLVLTDQLNRLSLCALGACQAPEDIFASAITTTTLTVNWDNITGVTGWEVRYRNYATGGTWTVVTTATNSKGLTGLTSGITYEIQVRTECDTDVFSMWTISYLVRTD